MAKFHFEKNIKKHFVLAKCFYRNSGIRTHDLLLLKQALYQTELYSEDAPNLGKKFFTGKGCGQIFLHYFRLLSRGMTLKPSFLPIFKMLEPELFGSVL